MRDDENIQGDKDIIQEVENVEQEEVPDCTEVYKVQLTTKGPIKRAHLKDLEDNYCIQKQ